MSARCLGASDDTFGFRFRNLPDGCKESPLIGMRSHRIVKKHAVLMLARLLLKRQSDQVTQLSLGECVLIGEESVVGPQSDLGPSFHGFREKMRAQFPRKNGRYGFLQEQPQMRSVAGARTFDGRGDPQLSACLSHSRRILSPCFPVEISSKQEAGLVQEHGIHAHYEFAAVGIVTRQVLPDSFVSDGQEATV
jgi:hypothetical protein